MVHLFWYSNFIKHKTLISEECIRNDEIFLKREMFLLLSYYHYRFVFTYFFPGFPQVEYRWMKDGVFLSDFSSEHFYKIQSVSRSDAGDYRCYAKNSVGTIISEKIKLTVACKESLLLFLWF